MSRFKPPYHAPRDAPPESGSGIVNVAERSIVTLLPPGPEAQAVRQALLDRGFIVHPCGNAKDAEGVRGVSRFALVDVALPGVIDFVRLATAAPDRALVLAVLDPGAPEGSALVAGAGATVHRPLDVSTVLVLVGRLQTQLEQRALVQAASERNDANVLGLSSPISASIAHEIRNPLAAARLNVSLLRQAALEGGPRLANAERSAMLADVEEALGRIESIVTAVNGLVRGERPVIHRVELLEIVRAALAQVSDRNGWVQIDGTSSVYGRACRGLLQQVVVNLVMNALDAVTGNADPKVLVRVYETAGEARVSVRDNGPGIPPSLRERVFDPFFSTKGTKGTGLGLAISRQAIASMGGALTLSSETGLGACFRIRLPRAEPD